MEASDTSLYITGPISADEERHILWKLRPTLCHELRALLVDEDTELGYGITRNADAIVTDVSVHARVSNLEETLGIIRKLYSETGLTHRAMLLVYGTDSEVVAQHPISGE